jgi:hypothetical protein
LQLLDRCGLGQLDGDLDASAAFSSLAAGKVDAMLALIRRNVELESSVAQLRAELIGAGEGILEEQQRHAELLGVLSQLEKAS